MDFLFLAAVIVVNALFSLYIDIRQYRRLRKAKLDGIPWITSEKDLQKSTAYNKDKLLFECVYSLIDAAKDVATLPLITAWHSLFSKYFSSPAVPFFLSYLVAITFFKVPFSAFLDYVIEEKYGFNKKTPGVFFTDILINLGLIFVIGTPFLYAVFHIIIAVPRFELFLSAFIALFQLFILWVYPYLIAPLYNTFTPLENKALKEKVEQLAASAGFKVGKIEVMDGSKRTGHSNAFFIGLGKVKKIVFYNTLLTQVDENELLAILAHELGHWHYGHLFMQLAVSWTQVFGYVFALKFLIGPITEKTIGMALLRFMFASSAIAVPLQFVTNLFSRMCERQADSYAVGLGHGENLKSALVKLHKENLGTPVIDWLFSAVRFSHPHTLERLRYVDDAMKKAE